MVAASIGTGPRSSGRPVSASEARTFCHTIARLATGSLYAELVLYPKPGLVSLIDNGSHDDMTADTFMRSLFSLRHYFASITKAGLQNASFDTLKQLGIAAEHTMLGATGGINTHRGAIFCMGMLCAAMGRCHALGADMTPQTIRDCLLRHWGVALSQHTASPSDRSHGQQVAARHMVSGAREEIAQGLPAVFEVALPILQRTLAAGRTLECAQIDALFGLMAYINDTNIYHRGGIAGARTVSACAHNFLNKGGTADAYWRRTALACHRHFVRLKLSPGGAADLLAATRFVHQVTSTSFATHE